MNLRKRMARGFTLVELMIVVAIIGILAALAIYGVRKYLLNAKTAEARAALGRLSKDAATAYIKEGMAATVLNLGSSTGVTNRLCASTTTTVPAAKTSIEGKKYQSNPGEWKLGGWDCLKFSMSDPQYYMYNYTASGTQGVAGETFTAIAQGDLDGNTVLSTFSVGGSIQTDSTNALTVVIAPNIGETLPEE